MPDPPEIPAAGAGAAAELRARVLAWYAGSARDLPWRHPGRPDDLAWPVLVSEVMLQQTPVARVEPVWRAWLERWPTPSALAADPAGEAVRAWGRLGYPRRALRLHAAATAVVERHGGRVPSDPVDLRALPGVGEYTAAAVGAFAFGQRVAVVDTNVRRVLVRAVQGRAQPAPALTAAETALARAVLPEAPPDDPLLPPRWSVAVMELGALVCTARSPRCGACPVLDLCAWQRAGAPPDEGPVRRGQAWHGTDRQVRGRLLALLRETPGALDAAALATAWDDDAQRARCLASLVEDGLVVPADGGWSLPS